MSLCECVCGMSEFPAQITHVISLEKVVFWLVFHQLCHVVQFTTDIIWSDDEYALPTWHNRWNTNQKMTFSKEITCVIWAGNSNIPHTHSHKCVVLKTAIKRSKGTYIYLCSCQTMENWVRLRFDFLFSLLSARDQFWWQCISCQLLLVYSHTSDWQCSFSIIPYCEENTNTIPSAVVSNIIHKWYCCTLRDFG